MKILLLVGSVLFLSFGLKTGTDTKLQPLNRTIEINECLEFPDTGSGCTIEDITCSSCEASASNVCCQKGSLACYYWITHTIDS